MQLSDDTQISRLWTSNTSDIDTKVLCQTNRTFCVCARRSFFAKPRDMQPIHQSKSDVVLASSPHPSRGAMQVKVSARAMLVPKSRLLASVSLWRRMSLADGMSHPHLHRRITIQPRPCPWNGNKCSSTRRTPVFCSYGTKNYACPTIAWRYLLGPSVPPKQFVFIFQAYALNEMANIERLRNVQEEITSTVDRITNDFKQRMQSILSDNQLLPSREWRWSEYINAADLYSFSSGAAYIGSFHSDQRWSADEQRSLLRRNECMRILSCLVALHLSSF